jgi:riboflavin kinase / FMN adenylyltransferase
VAHGASPIKLINTLEEKIELLEAHGIDHLVIVPFTESFSNQSAEEYIREFLIKRFQPHTIIIGYDHRFGKGRSGNYLLLEEKAPVYSYILKEIPKHVLDEIAISSTKIRESLQAGNTAVAEKLLGYPFFFEGKVIHGDKIGRTLGYPTANLAIEDEEKLVPGDGIYAVYVVMGQSKVKSKNSKSHTPYSGLQAPDSLKGMMSIGFRPTVNGKKRVIEVNIFDFDEDIYGKTIRVFIKKYLRPEVKFDSLDDLIKQIDQDKEESLKIL